MSLELRVDSKLYEKPIYWDFHYLVIKDGRLASAKVESSNGEIEGKIYDIVNDPQFFSTLQTLETRQLNLLHFNLIHIPPRYSTEGRSQEPSPYLLQMIQKVEDVIRSRMGHLPERIAMPLPSEIDEKIRSIYDQCAYFYEAMSSDYCMFLHGQDTQFLPYFSLIKEIAKLEQPETDFSNFKVLRSQPVAYHTIEQYLPFSVFNELSFERRSSILSVSVCSSSDDEGESAYHFLLNNRSVNYPFDCFMQDLTSLLGARIQDPRRSLVEQIILDRCELVHSNSGNVGNLMMICIPKEFACSPNGPLWICKELGIPYIECAPRQTIIDLLQRGDVEKAKSLLRESTGKQLSSQASIQGRLMVHQLSKQNGVKIFQFNRVPWHIRKCCRERMKSIAAEACHDRLCLSASIKGKEHFSG